MLRVPGIHQYAKYERYCEVFIILIFFYYCSQASDVEGPVSDLYLINSALGSPREKMSNDM